MYRASSPGSTVIALVAVLSITLGVAGCSSGQGDRSAGTTSSSAQGPRSTTTGDRPPVTGTTTPTTAAGSSTSGTGSSVTTTLMPTPPRDPRALQFRPVVGSQPCSAVTPDLPSEPQSTETTIPPSGQPQLYEALDGQLCYGLGPSAADGTDLTGAKAAKGPNGWTIEVEAKPASAAKLNALFDDCYRGTDLCPASEGGHGFVAVVIDSKVASAPSIQATGLASKPFQISGSFSRAEAMALAALLNS